MSDSQRYAVDTHEVISEVFDGEAVIIQMRTGAYYSFPPEVTLLWGALLGGTPFDQLVLPAEGSDLQDVLGWLEGEELVAFDPALNDSRSPAEPGTGPCGITKFTDMAEMLIADPIHDIDYDGDALAPRTDI